MFLCYTFLSLVPAFLIVYSLKITWMDRQGLTHLFTTQITVLVSAKDPQGREPISNAVKSHYDLKMTFSISHNLTLCFLETKRGKVSCFTKPPVPTGFIKTQVRLGTFFRIYWGLPQTEIH